jgi:hypothetical protein
MIEFWLAFAGNLQGYIVFASLVLAVGALMVRAVCAIESGDPFWTRGAVAALAIAGFGGLLGCVPTVDDVWKTRIALVKYHLAAPENVQAATETIERLGKKLECKYLGGCEETKP